MKITIILLLDCCLKTAINYYTLLLLQIQSFLRPICCITQPFPLFSAVRCKTVKTLSSPHGVPKTASVSPPKQHTLAFREKKL